MRINENITQGGFITQLSNFFLIITYEKEHGLSQLIEIFEPRFKNIENV